MAAIFADDIFKRSFFNQNVCILNEISLKFVSDGRIDNKSVLVQEMAGRNYTTVEQLPSYL